MNDKKIVFLSPRMVGKATQEASRIAEIAIRMCKPHVELKIEVISKETEQLQSRMRELEKLLERCQERLDGESESDDLYCLINKILSSSDKGGEG